MWVRRARCGDRVQPGIDVGEEHPEVLEPGRDRRHGLGLAGRPLAFQVGDHRVADRRADLGQPLSERNRPAAAGQLVDDPEVEQHPLGVADRREVVVVALAGALVAVAAGRGERLQVDDGELVQAPSGLDEQPGRHL